MPFWAYMLYCADRSFYVGHTDDLEARLGQHQQSIFGGYTATRLPVELVWCSDFTTRYEALTAEKQIKGWSPAKKMALIRGDWKMISVLARGKGRASTSSAQTVEVDAQDCPPTPFGLSPSKASPSSQAFSLEPHPDTPSTAVTCIQATAVRTSPSTLTLHFQLTGNPASLRLPPLSAPVRTDELWRHTCLEAFVRLPGEEAYFELNLAPSSQWAAYAFTGYRAGMVQPEIAPPEIDTRTHRDGFELLAHVNLPHLPDDTSWQLGLSAVIEEASGQKSYWALAHPPGPPDFHHADCFTLELAAPSGP